MLGNRNYNDRSSAPDLQNKLITPLIIKSEVRRISPERYMTWRNVLDEKAWKV